MEVEDHFGITIQESTAEAIRTVGDLAACWRNGASDRLKRSVETGIGAMDVIMRITVLRSRLAADLSQSVSFMCGERKCSGANCV